MAVNITLSRVMAAVEADDLIGFCLACGSEAWEVESDARREKCEECGAYKVYGAQEILIMIAA